MSGKEGEKAQVSAELQQFIAQEQAKAQVRLGIRNKAMFESKGGPPDRRGRVGSWARGRRPIGVHSIFPRYCVVDCRVQSPSIPYLTALADNLDVQLQQTISRLTDECWDKCVSSPSTYFSGKENACLDNCAKRFMDTTQFVIKYYNSKNARGGGGEGFDEFA